MLANHVGFPEQLKFTAEQRGDRCQGNHDEGCAQDGIGRARGGLRCRRRRRIYICIYNYIHYEYSY
jgi:hypothetical protein